MTCPLAAGLTCPLLQAGLGSLRSDNSHLLERRPGCGVLHHQQELQHARGVVGGGPAAQPRSQRPRSSLHTTAGRGELGGTAGVLLYVCCSLVSVRGPALLGAGCRTGISHWQSAVSAVHLDAFGTPSGGCSRPRGAAHGHRRSDVSCFLDSRTWLAPISSLAAGEAATRPLSAAAAAARPAGGAASWASSACSWGGLACHVITTVHGHCDGEACMQRVQVFTLALDINCTAGCR